MKILSSNPAWLSCVLAGWLVVADASSSEIVAGDWPRPAPVRELITTASLFRIFAEQVSADVESRLAASPAPTGDVLARLLALRVHLGLYLGRDGRALAAATQIRERVTPPAERPFSGLLTEALVVARAAAPAGPSSSEYAAAARTALESRLATLPVTPELTALLVRQRGRFHDLTRDALLAEATQLGARLDSARRWTLADVDEVARLGHRLATILPVQNVLLAAFDAALARQTNAGPPASTPAALRARAN